MKRLLTALAILLLPVAAWGGFFGGGAAGTNTLQSYTVATLPAGSTGLMVYVTDGADATDCTTGSGSTKVTCIYNGSAWTSVGVAGASTTSDTAYGAGWNGDTTHSPSMNVTYDEMELRVPKSLYDAQTVLAATSDNTPAALTVTEQTVVGRATGGNVAALAIDADLAAVSANDDTVPSAKAVKAVTDTLVTKALFDANTILAANSDNTPAAVTVTEDKLVGRATGGNIGVIGLAAGLTISDGNLTVGTLNQNTTGNAATATALAADPAGCTNQFTRDINASGVATCASVAASDITNNTITATQLAAALTFADGDLLDLSGVTMSAGADEGLALPTYADVAPTTEKYYVAYDAANNALMVRESGGWINVGASAAAPTNAHYITTAANGNLTEESVLTEGLAIDITDAGGDGGAVTLAFDPTELTGNRTWSAGGSATVAWTIDLSGTDDVVTFGSDLVTLSNSLTVATGKNITLGTTQWNSADEIDGTKIKDADYGDISVSAGGAWSIDNSAVTVGKLASADFGDFTCNGSTCVIDSAAYSMDEIADGTNYQKVAASDVDASNHVNLIQDSDGTGAVQFTGPTATRAITVDDAAQELAARNRANTFTENNTFGNANSDTLTVQSSMKGSGRAVTIDDDGTTSPTYATGTQELFVTGDIETPATVYSAAINTGSGSDGSRTITMTSNTAVTPAGNQLYFLNNILKVSENGTERDVVTPADSVTWTGTTHSFAGVTNFVLPTAAPDAAGEMGINTTSHQLQLHSGAAVVTMDFDSDSAGYVLKSDGSGNFTLQADATGGTPTLDSVSDPTADTTIDMDAGEEVNWDFSGAFTTGSQFKIEQKTGNPSGGVLFEVKAADTDITLARLGDGTNYSQFATNGNLTFAGTATFSAAGATSSIPVVVGTGTASGVTAAGQMYFESDTEILTIGDGATSIGLDMAPNVVYTFPAATSTLARTDAGQTFTGVQAFTAPTVATSIAPASADGATIGTASTEFSDLYLADGAVIYGQADQSNTMTSSATGWDLNKPLGLYSANDPDVAAEGKIAWDANGDYMRGYDGTRQVGIARVQEEIHVTVYKPNDMDDAQRDHFWIWSNESGMSFIVTGWKGWSTSDDTTLIIYEEDADGANDATVDAVELATGAGPYTGSDTTITGATIETGHLIYLDFDDTDAPAMVKMTIYGYYNADVN